MLLKLSVVITLHINAKWKSDISYSLQWGQNKVFIPNYGLTFNPIQWRDILVSQNLLIWILIIVTNEDVGCEEFFPPGWSEKRSGAAAFFADAWDVNAFAKAPVFARQTHQIASLAWEEKVWWVF